MGGWTVRWADGRSDGRTAYLLCDQRLVRVEADGLPLLLRLHVDAHVSLSVSGQTEVKTHSGPTTANQSNMLMLLMDVLHAKIRSRGSGGRAYVSKY